MIPNVGEMSFYMSTMISDFANNILTEFGNLVCQFILYGDIVYQVFELSNEK